MPDLKTAILSYAIINAVCTIVIALLWFQNRSRFAGIGMWLASFAMQVAGLVLIFLRGILPDILSIVAGNALLIAASIVLYVGLERFVDRRTSQIHNYLLLVVFTLVHTYFTFWQPSLLARNINISLGILIIFSQSTWLAFRRVETGMRHIMRELMIVCAIFCLISIGRVVEILVSPQGEKFFLSSLPDMLFLLSYEIIFIFLTFSLFLMINRRLFAELENDLTERKRAKVVLQVSDEKFQKAFHASPDAITISRMCDGKIVEVNEGFSRIYGYSREEALSSSSKELGIWANSQDREACMTALSENHRIYGYEYNFRTKSGRIINCMYSGEVIYLDDEAYILSVVRNITDHKQLEDTLRRRNNMLAALHDATLGLIDRYEVNDILEAFLIKVSELLDAPQVSINLIEGTDTLVTHAVTAGQPLRKGDTIQRGEGGILSWQAIDSRHPAVLEDYSTWPKRHPLYDGFSIHAIMIIPILHREHVIGAINISRSEPGRPFNETDIYVAEQLAQMVALVLDNAQVYTQLQSELTERIRSEEALQEAQDELVAQQRMVAVFEERQRLARDLHDSVNQSIHSLVLFSETLLSTLEKNNPERAREIAVRLQESARQALKETRLMLYELQPHAPGRSVDLLQDLEARLATVERRAGVRADIILEGSLDHCPREWQENLFWIVIEALNNALKHARARNVKILIRSKTQSMELEVVDNGKGFDPSRPRSGGMGIRNMHERAELLGGKLTILSALEDGTCVRFDGRYGDK